MIVVPPTMLTLDEPEHTKYRSLVSRLFTGSQVKKAEEQVQAVVDETADAFMAKARGQSDIDFMEEFAFPVPLRIIADRLGIPEEDRPLFDDGATAAASGLRLSPLAPEEMLRRARLAVDLQQLLVRLLEARRTDRRDRGPVPRRAGRGGVVPDVVARRIGARVRGRRAHRGRAHRGGWSGAGDRVLRLGRMDRLGSVLESRLRA